MSDFSVDALSIDDRMMEYCLELDDKKFPLVNLADKRNSQLLTKQPMEGWLRFQTTENPEVLTGHKVLSLFIEGSVGTRHEITKVSDRRGHGEITYQQVKRLNL